MSFIRPGQGRRKKALVKKKPQWDDTVNDLDSYRATPAEIRQRREAHKSKNHISVKLEKLRKEKQHQRSGLSNVEARQVAIMKEVLHDQQQLDTVLAKTDHMLSVVKDLFGDDAKKFTGHPTVTLPPGNQQRNTTLPGAPEIRTRTEKLSDSVMSQSALNDLSASSEDDSEEEEQQGSQPVSFQSRLDLQRFQHFVQEEENRNSNAIPTLTTLNQADLQRLQQLQQILWTQERHHGNSVPEENPTVSSISGNAGISAQFGQFAEGPAHSTHIFKEPPVSLSGQQTPPNSIRTDSGGRPTPPRSALNDTGKVKKSKGRVHPRDSAPANSSSFNVTDMKQVLENLQAEIADFERKTGRRCSADVENNETFTGYTVALVTAVTKLTHYMKETELRLQAEMMVREQLAQDVRQLTITIDSLTQELIMTQEESSKLSAEFHHYRQQVQGEMALLQAQLLEVKHQQSAHGSQHSTPGKAASAGSDNEEEKYSALPEHVTPPSAAVLLSPVVRKSRVSEEVQQEPTKAKRQTSLVDIPGLIDGTSSLQQAAAAAPKVSLSMTTSVSSTAAVPSDPPRLTQTLPLMATVNVPKPVPLIQSNLSLPGSQAAGLTLQTQTVLHTNSSVSNRVGGNTHCQLPSGGSTAARDGPGAMESQIAELNRQHAEAQHRLQALLVQQKQQHGQLQLLQVQDAATKDRPVSSTKSHAVQQGTVPSSVSPPISPISHRSEQFTHLDPLQRLTSMSREIKVAMPMVDLEVSAGSLNSSL